MPVTVAVPERCFDADAVLDRGPDATLLRDLEAVLDRVGVSDRLGEREDEVERVSVALKLPRGCVIDGDDVSVPVSEADEEQVALSLTVIDAEGESVPLLACVAETEPVPVLAAVTAAVDDCVCVPVRLPLELLVSEPELEHEDDPEGELDAVDECETVRVLVLWGVTDLLRVGDSVTAPEGVDVADSEREARGDVGTELGDAALDALLVSDELALELTGGVRDVEIDEVEVDMAVGGVRDAEIEEVEDDMAVGVRDAEIDEVEVEIDMETDREGVPLFE